MPVPWLERTVSLQLQPMWPDRNVGLELPDLLIFQDKPKIWTII